jgi:hypothetical protein
VEVFLSREYSADEAKAETLNVLRNGGTIAAAMRKVNKSYKSFEYYMRSDARFKADVEKIRRTLSGVERPTVPNFPRFCEKYFGMKLFWHQLQWYDILEGKDPRDLHPEQVYEPRDPNLVLINTPPFHAKSMTISINYVTYRIVEDPNIRVLIVSKTGQSANKFLSAIKDRLSSKTRLFQELKDDYAPPEGYDGNDAVWRSNMIYLNPNLRTRGEKDPTVQALGIGQHIYGARADLIILDDCVDLDNAHEFEKQINWIQNIVDSRLEPGGLMLAVGTRLAAQELYSELRNPAWYTDGDIPWTYLSQPAVLEFDEDPEKWVTLWPRTNFQPPGKAGQEPPGEDGMWPMWDGPRLAKVRSRRSAENWNRVYQQAQVSATATFTVKMLEGCTDALRVPGVMVNGQRGHRPDGMSGLFVIAGLDPAPSNYTAAVVIGVDRATGRRYVLDVWNQHGATPSQIRALVKAWTVRYGILEWRIEENGLNNYISQDEEILRWCRSRGVGVFGHLTNKNKWDPQFGVATMANLFLGHEEGGNMIHLPNRRGHHGMQSLYEQLLAWYPTPSQTKMPTQDCVMALWFAELRARTVTDEFDHTTHMDSDMMSEHDKENQITIDMDDWLARSHSGGEFMMLDDWFEQQNRENGLARWSRGGF